MYYSYALSVTYNDACLLMDISFVYTFIITQRHLNQSWFLETAFVSSIKINSSHVIGLYNTAVSLNASNYWKLWRHKVQDVIQYTYLDIAFPVHI